MMLSMIYADQTLCIAGLTDWWTGDRRYAVLEGAAGTGKTFIIQQILAEFRNCTPIITAPTHEAIGQLRKVLPLTQTICTTYSALGFAFDTSTEIKKLKRVKIISDLSDYNLLIIDEYSMIGEILFEAIEDAKIKTLFVGHKNQLPEVNVNLSRFDKCECYISLKKYLTFTLTISKRNLGKISKFCSKIEKTIYNKPRIIPNDYNISFKDYEDYLKDNIKSIAMLDTRIIAWDNNRVNFINRTARTLIFGKRIESYIPGDRILTTQPTLYSVGVKIHTFPAKVILKASVDLLTLSTNSNLEIVERKLVKFLKVECLCLKCEYKDTIVYIYLPDIDQYKKLCKEYLFIAYSRKHQKAKIKAFQNYHIILMLFAKVKYSYAITVHRSQGMTIPNVIVRADNIMHCPNVYLKYKLLYVACSRARDSLRILR